MSLQVGDTIGKPSGLLAPWHAKPVLQRSYSQRCAIRRWSLAPEFGSSAPEVSGEMFRLCMMDLDEIQHMRSRKPWSLGDESFVRPAFVRPLRCLIYWLRSF